MRIIHLSDIHYSVNINLTIFDALFHALVDINTEKHIDLIIISGDLIDKGNAGCKTTVEGFNKFELNFFNRIVETIEIPKENIIFCPGNHDVDRNAIEPDTSKFIDNCIKDESFNTFLQNIRNNESSYKLSELKDFKSFEKHIHSSVSENHITEVESLYERIIDGISVSILCLNSVWNKKGIIGECQIVDNEKKLKESDFNILVSHYPIQPLNDGEPMLMEMIRNNFDLCCTGHKHSQEISCVENNQHKKSIHSTCRGSIPYNIFQKDSNYSNGFWIFDFDGSNIECKQMIYNQIYSKFHLDNMYFGGNNSCTYLLKEKKESKRNKKEMNCVPIEEKQFELFTESFQANGSYQNNNFKVHKNSTINPNISRNAFINNQRESFVSSGKIVNNKLKEDITFESPSKAASFVAGYNCNGYISWKEKNGTSLQESLSHESIDNKIITTIKHKNSISSRELAEILNLSENTVRHHLHKLMENGVLLRIGSAKIGTWIINK